MGQFWRHNWGYKLVALLLAILLWLWVPERARPNTETPVPLLVKGIPNNLVITSKMPSSVSVSIQGSDSSQITAVLDLSTGVKGEKTYPVVISAQGKIKNFDVTPDRVDVTLDELKEKSVPVTVNLTGSIASGYDKANPIVRPATVTVRGPDKSLAKINKALVEVSLANATETIQVPATVLLQDASGQPISGPDPFRPIITIQPQEVSIIIPVTKKDLSSKAVPVRVTTMGTPGNGFAVGQVFAIPGVVKIYGIDEKLKTIDHLNGGVINVTGATQDVAMDIRTENLGLPADVTMEPGIKLSGVARLVQVPIQRTLGKVPINVRGLAEGLTANLSANTTDVVIKGTPDALNSLKNTDKLLWVDATGMAAGQEKEVQVYYDVLPPGVEISNLPKVVLSIK